MLFDTRKFLYHKYLPGLGKTFIAAVVMYNYYRWFPLGKLIFMAPTKPLVAQQVCYTKRKGLCCILSIHLLGLYV